MTRNAASREEWLLLYRRGLEPADIARICHTLPQTAEAYIRVQLARDPSLFDTRLGRCLEPSLPVFRDEDTSRGWDGNLLSLSRFVEAHARFPRRSANTTTATGALEVFLYHWVRAQRGRSAVGELTARQERQLEGIPRWTVLGRDQLHTRHWDERLTACRVFVAGSSGSSTCASSATRDAGSPRCSRGAIYLNFFTHHYIWDLRWVLFAAVVVVFGRCRMHYRVFRLRMRMPLVVAFVLVAVFIWLAENIATWSNAWAYPDQVDGWHLVSVAKLGSWLLLMIISVVLVAWVYPPEPPPSEPAGRRAAAPGG